ncbi:MAG: redoxin domain-containing protein [Acidobacteria bacterium]|nr:redoxin domain-containing protein [Acidobacteriota bacterium]
MTAAVVVAFVATWLALLLVGWFAFQLLRQNGRALQRIEALEEMADRASEAAAPRPFGDRSLKGSRLNRDGLAPGTAAPRFQLPRVGGGELSLDEYAGRRVFLVFSDPACGPCNTLAPELERKSRQTAGTPILMVSRGGTEANLRKIEEHGLTFPVVLQQHWEISRAYGKFATPIAYFIDEDGRIAAPVAQGVEPILKLWSSAGDKRSAGNHEERMYG